MILKRFKLLTFKVVLLIRVSLLKRTKQFNKLENLCRRVLNKNPQNYLANLWLGEALRKQSKLDEAVEVYRRIPQLVGSKFFLDTFDLLWVLYEAGRYGEAITAGEDALRKLNSGSLGLESALRDVYLDTAHRVVGGSYAELGEYDRAIPHLEIACKLDKATYPEKLQQLLQRCRERLERQRLEGSSSEKEPREEEES